MKPYRSPDDKRWWEKQPGDPGYGSELDPEPERHRTDDDGPHRLRIELRWERHWIGVCRCGWRSRLFTHRDAVAVAWGHHVDAREALEW